MGADPQVTSITGQTPLDKALDKNHPECAGLLHEHMD